ncbi:radical SAM protein [archaeon]|jgi:MoaA/NifB/PqqE/SkfB family radical SAM enzyme|nr:radical SAM protein [archaeon]
MENGKQIEITTPDVAVQFGLGSALTGDELTNLWIETTKPEHCNLACSYCYASGGERQEGSLTQEQWMKALEQASAVGITSIGIPGAGEPFLPVAKERTMAILEKCKDLGIYTTLFTTGEFIDQDLADRLYELPVEIMLKGNSILPDVQNSFVSDPATGRIITGYGEKRNAALELLVETGFNDPQRCQDKFQRQSRMGLVTSVMTDNIPKDQEAPITPTQVREFVEKMREYQGQGLTGAYISALSELSNAKFDSTSNYQEAAFLQSFARTNNIIFDVDSVLKRGRGATCCLSPEDQRMKDKFNEIKTIDKDVFGLDWGVNTTYVGVACERPRRHLYINFKGDIRPCIGATGVDLGNIAETSLEEAWESPEMKIIREKKYVGKCAEQCANYVETDKRTGSPLCNSCLGRSTEELTNKTLLDKGCVQTIGCWNYRDKK